MGAITAKVQFERVGNSPDAWQSVASNLLFASQVLTERCDVPEPSAPVVPAQYSNLTRLGAVELMLRGMAIECLLKALWLKQGKFFVEEGEFARVPKVGSHNLLELAEAVSLWPTDIESTPLEGLEKDLLIRLSHFIECGRYPIPMNSDKLLLTKRPKGGKSSKSTWSPHSDNPLFDKLVLRVTEFLAANYPICCAKAG